MAQKPNFLKKLIAAGLVTASTATIVAGFAGSAMGAATQQNRTTAGAATTVDGAGFDQTAAPANLAVAPNAVITANANNAIANNDLSGVGTIDSGAAASTLVFNLTNPTTQKAPLILDNAARANGTLNVTNGFIQVSNKTFATIKTINIGDGQGVIFNTDATNGNALNLQVGGATINFNGTDGTGRLVLLSNAAGGGATDFNVTGSLGGNLKGIIEFNTTAVAGQLIANAVIGTNNGAGRAAGFVVSVANGNAATIAGQVYAKDMVIQSTNAGGQVNFDHIVDVGTDGTTAFKTAASKVAITQNSNFGATDFGNLAVQITVPGTKILTER